MSNLVELSIQVILENQNHLGAYIACPTFRNYRYCWLRDGGFIAYSMLRTGFPDSTRKYLGWVHRVILRYRDKVERLHSNDFLPARYTMGGYEVSDDWPNFQIDGYGTWLWCLAEYVRRTGDSEILKKFKESIRLTIEYLSRVWRRPNYDCWEENGESIHPSTLACVHGGIRAINEFLRERELAELAAEIKDFLLANLTEDGRLPKSIGSDSIDASLIWVSVPFGTFDPKDTVMKKTIQVIEQNLVKEGGVQRYPKDTYYGGGQWILLTCWLGWYYARQGHLDKARMCLKWVEQRADEQGHLAEQDLIFTNDPAFIEPWEKRAGGVAKPLLWSHAMYLILVEECKVPHSQRETNHDNY